MESVKSPEETPSSASNQKHSSVMVHFLFLLFFFLLILPQKEFWETYLKEVQHC